MVIILKEFTKINVANGVDIIYAPADRFKTNEISVSFLTPLSEESASANAVCINLLSHTTKSYPTISEFNKRLAMLYGASVNSSVSKLGENQMLTLMISSLNDRFSLSDEKISTESFRLLMSLVFDANIDEKGEFSAADIQREKRLLCEKLDSEDNEKRIYALRKLEENMFRGEPYAVNRYGTRENINALTSNDLTVALDSFKTKSKVQITIVGTVDIDEIVSVAKECFASVKREYAPPVCSVFKPKADKVNTVTERIAVKQGKLVLGFRVNNQSEFESNPVMRLFSDIFGGGPYSKLFENVREKLSLCYYCSARYDRRKSNIIVQCGCEEENMDKAVDEILAQLDDISKGKIDEELAASKMAISDLINGVSDDSVSLLSWYVNQITDEKILTPSESARENDNITKDEIGESADLLSLDTIFKLVAAKEDEK